ncbi:hypothetical protein [Rhodococcus sp. AH-ZY2]|nr:hypothetical protein [Rhodococcus sp. AH-ZY2]WML61907.1 hypothetical protein QNA09_18905 [Rhodococcus sp. AH-ZY2]
MSILEISLVSILFAENVALLLAPMWDTPHRDRDSLGEAAQQSMRRLRP